MEKQALLEKTLENLSRLPNWRVREISDYVDFLIQKNEDKNITKGIKEIISQSQSFQFLEEEQELYSDSDLIQKY
ncbi:hypothetical protein [Gillisia limnaea]|jgi:hypothetical protein|uniref:DUF2281 domain-containing protein n=1 Tax=Gillisia limnaea (strain DSM 15749 / LMG 21470 / R-8282) TaxID=865937 RepID=H2C012_GILLR|nr:hypothetical protein [Gillisia limnaea]EHQ02379.1 hypothetical protein Gilli_1736 [Gillisia limnaea DSM 15749]